MTKRLLPNRRRIAAFASSRRDGEKTKTSEESHTKGNGRGNERGYLCVFNVCFLLLEYSRVRGRSSRRCVPTSVEAQYEAAQQVGGGEKAPELKGESSSAVAEPSSVPAVDAPTPCPKQLRSKRN